MSNRSFYQDKLGTNTGKLKKRRHFLQATARVYPMVDDSEGAVLTLAVPAGAPNPTEVRAAAWEMGATML